LAGDIGIVHLDLRRAIAHPRADIASFYVERLLVKARLGRERDVRAGLQIEAGYVIRGVGGKTGRAVKVGIELVLASNLITLAEHRLCVRARHELCRVAEAHIGAYPGLDPVVTGELVDIKEKRIVEHQAERVLVRDVLLVARGVRPRDDLGDRLEDMGDAPGRGDEGIAIFETGNRVATRKKPTV